MVYSNPGGDYPPGPDVCPVQPSRRGILGAALGLGVVGATSIPHALRTLTGATSGTDTPPSSVSPTELMNEAETQVRDNFVLSLAPRMRAMDKGVRATLGRYLLAGVKPFNPAQLATRIGSYSSGSVTSGVTGPFRKSGGSFVAVDFLVTPDSPDVGKIYLSMTAAHRTDHTVEDSLVLGYGGPAPLLSAFEQGKYVLGDALHVMAKPATPLTLHSVQATHVEAALPASGSIAQTTAASLARNSDGWTVTFGQHEGALKMGYSGTAGFYGLGKLAVTSLDTIYGTVLDAMPKH